MRRLLAVGLMTLPLGSCSSTPADLEAKTAPIVTSYNENYQELYRRVAGTAKRCFAGNVSAYASFAVDTELFSELGYGEMSVSLINMGTRNYYVSAKFEKQPAGSKMTIRSGNTLAANRYVDTVQRWANGTDLSCPLI